jgi:hypothetical protein
MRILDIIGILNEMATLSRAQLLDPRTKWRGMILLKKVSSGATVHIEEKVDGKIVRIPVKLDNSPLEINKVAYWLADEAAQSRTNLMLKTMSKKYPYVSVNKIAKDKDFGGEELASRERVEQGQIASINQHIQATAKKLKSKTINLKVGDRIVQAGGVVKATPGVKADAQLVDGAGNPVAWISLKDGPGPKAIAGWGGVTHAPIVHHPEIQDFIAQSQILFGKKGIPRATSMGREIQDPKLKNQIVFGKEFGGNPGPSNVDAVMAGDIQIRKIDKATFEIHGAANTWANGETPEGGFDPVLNISYKGDRDNAGIPGARISVQPTGGRRWDPIDGAVKQPAQAEPAKELPQDSKPKEPLEKSKKTATKPVAPSKHTAEPVIHDIDPSLSHTPHPDENIPQTHVTA